MFQAQKSPVSALLLPFLMALSVLGACTKEADQDPKAAAETIDVPPALEIPIDNDPQAVPRKIDVSGIMPSNFPKSLPLYGDSSLMNFGDDDGKAWVDLLTQDGSAQVEKSLRRALGRAGWSVEEAAPGVWQLGKGATRARVLFRDGDPGTVYRYEY